MSDKKTEEMEKIADKLISRYSINANAKLLTDAEKDTIKEYIMGSARLDELYSFADNMPVKWWYSIQTGLVEFDNTYNDEGFFRRCIIVHTLMRMGNELHRCLIAHENWQQFSPEKIERLYADYEKEGLKLKYQLYIIDIMEERGYKVNNEEVLADALRKVFTRYLEERREETLEAFAGASALARWFVLTVLAQKPEENKSEILSYAQDGASIVRNLLFDMLCERKDWEEEIKKLAISKKLAERELAARVLINWQSSGIDCVKILSDMLEKEKSAKLAAMIRNSISENTGTGESTDNGIACSQNEITPDDLVKQLHKGGRRRSFEWAYRMPFGVVHKKDGTVADDDYMQAFLLCYSTSDEYGIIKDASILADGLKEDELAAFVNELYDRWLALGAEAKKRWVLYVASIYGKNAIVSKIKRQIDEWVQNARTSIAMDAVDALALNPASDTLILIDNMSRKHKSKAVKSAAKKALENTASRLGLTGEELADKMIPDLGFDENMERVFDYGERKFKVAITPTLEIEVFDETGKKLKSLPAVNKKDDEALGKAALDEFKQMKKQIKLIAGNQKSRLEYALMAKREWTAQAWKALFVKNPIMHQFATGLIWGVYEGGKLIQSFRYMEDGSFNTEDEEEYILPESVVATYVPQTAQQAEEATQAQSTQIQPAQTEPARTKQPDIKIGLVHPIELTDVSLSKWKQQLEDYEITQPIEQLYRPLYRISEEEQKQKYLERFGGYVLNELYFGGKLLGMGWYRGDVEDGGVFYTYYREEAEIGFGAELYMSGSSILAGHYGGTEDVTLYEVRFYKAGEAYKGGRSIPPKDIPPRYFSEIVLQLTNATVASDNRDEDWRKNRLV